MKKIKSTLTRVIHYLIVPVGLLYAAGMIDFVHFAQRIEKDSEIRRKTRFSKDELATLEITPSNYQNYLDSVMTLRSAQIKRDKVNDMNLYFHDLKQFDMFTCVYQDSFDRDSKGMGRMILLSFNSKKQDIINLNLGVNTASLPDNVVKKHINDVEKYRNIWFPKDYQREKDSKPINYYAILFSISSWFLLLYLRGMLFAAILFLFWRKRIRRKTVVPLGITSFITSVAIWPIIIIMDIRNRFSEFVSRSEVTSRRNSMLTLFSKQEQKLIEKSREMSRIEFNRYLDSIGMIRKHSLFLSIVVVVIMTITPRTALASTRIINAKVIKIEKVSYMLDWDIGDKVCQYCNQDDVQVFSLKEIKKIFHTEIIARLCKGYPQGIGGIPRCEISFS